MTCARSHSQHVKVISYAHLFNTILGSQVALVVKNPPASAGDVRDSGSISGSGRSPGGGHGNPLQYSCLENPMDRGVRQATVHRAAQSATTEATQYTQTITMLWFFFFSTLFLMFCCYKQSCSNTHFVYIQM